MDPDGVQTFDIRCSSGNLGTGLVWKLCLKTVYLESHVQNHQFLAQKKYLNSSNRSGWSPNLVLELVPDIPWYFLSKRWNQPVSVYKRSVRDSIIGHKHTFTLKSSHDKILDIRYKIGTRAGLGGWPVYPDGRSSVLQDWAASRVNTKYWLSRLIRL